MGLNKAIFRVSRSTCQLLSGCLYGLGLRFHGRRNTRRVMSSVRGHVSRLFLRGLGTNSRIVALTSMRRIVTHIKGPRSFKAASRRRGGASADGSASCACAAQHQLCHGPSSGLLNKMLDKLTTCLK